MKIKVAYYIPVEKEIEMTPEEYCYFHADGLLNGKKVVPDDAIGEEISISKEAIDELNIYLFSKKN